MSARCVKEGQDDHPDIFVDVNPVPTYYLLY